MRFLFMLAWRNLLRNRRRALLTFTIMAAGVAGYVFLAGLLEGFDVATIRNKIDFETGHFKIRSQQFDADRPTDLEFLIEEPLPLVEALRSLPFVTGATRRIHLLSELDNGQDSLVAVTVGLDPATDVGVFDLLKELKPGVLDGPGAVLGADLAKDLGLAEGDTVYLTFRGRGGQWASLELEARQLILSGDQAVNSATVFVGLPTLAPYLNTAAVTEVVVKTVDAQRHAEFRPLIAQKAAPNLVQSWPELTKDFAAILAAKKKSTSALMFFLMAIALVGIVNTLLMSVYEKRAEIGTMKALGFSNAEIRRLFLIEGCLIGLAGVLAGVVLGSLINLYFVVYGVDWMAMAGGSAKQFSMGLSGPVKNTWPWGAYATISLVSLVSSLAASWYPAAKAVKMRAVDALRTVQ